MILSFSSHLAYLFLALHTRTDELSWGTYVDAMGTHCNAHTNNLVILPKVLPKTSIILFGCFDFLT